jgi:hypothetical protein
MSLNARIGLAAGIALLLAPLWLPLLPFVLGWHRRQVRRARQQGLRALDASQARTIACIAEATMPIPPPNGWMAVACNVDRYLAAVRSPRRWRTMLLLTLLEWAPLLRLRPPMSLQPTTKRRAFLEAHMATTHGLLAIPALARQLVRMGYYADADIAQRLGFRTMRQRRVGPLAAQHDAATARKAVG